MSINNRITSPRSNMVLHSMHEEMFTLQKTVNNSSGSSGALRYALPFRTNDRVRAASWKADAHKRGTGVNGSERNEVPRVQTKDELEIDTRNINRRDITARQVWRDEALMFVLQQSPCLVFWRFLLRSRSNKTEMPSVQESSSDGGIFKRQVRSMEGLQHILPCLPVANAQQMDGGKPGEGK